VHTSPTAPDSNYGLYYALLLEDFEQGRGAQVCWLERCHPTQEHVLWEGTQDSLTELANFSHPVRACPCDC